jgi:hypothetical protein
MVHDVSRGDKGMEYVYQGYRIKPQGTYPFKVITAKGSGGVPVSLQGQYTTVPMAERAIDLYLDSLIKSKKVKHHAKTDSPS